MHPKKGLKTLTLSAGEDRDKFGIIQGGHDPRR